MNNHKSLILSAAALLCMAVPEGLRAVPAFPGVQRVTQPDGTVVELRLIGDEHAHVTVDASGMAMNLDHRGFWRSTGENGMALLRKAAARAASGKLKSSSKAAQSVNRTAFPRTGEPRALIVLVDFPDINFVTPDVKREFSEMLNLEGFDRREHIGSAADYFRAQSQGLFSPRFDVYGPVRASHPATYYGENDANGDDMRAYELAMEVCAKLDGEIDFADYDEDNDGYIDNVYMFYAGYGENFAGNKASWIWPHADHIENLGIPEADRTYDGRILNSYGCCAELYGSTGTDVAAIGTFCHEFGHILGLPDTYDVNYATDGSGFHPDQWDIMASGSYLPMTRNSGAVPAGYSAVERWLLGWAEPVEISRPQNVTLPPLHDSALSARISTGNDGEFFILENRQNARNSYDRFLPSHGMLAWHVDMRPDATVSVTISGNPVTVSCADAWTLQYNAVNMNAAHQCLEIEKASGNDGSKSSADTPFPGRQLITSFTDETSPSMKSWTGASTGKPVTDITENAGQISFRFMGGSDRTVKIGGTHATDITESGFTANWPLCDDATEGYRFRLYRSSRHTEEGVLTVDETFGEIPDGWNVTGDYECSGNAVTLGSSAVSELSSPVFDLSAGGRLTVRASQAGASAGMLTILCGDDILDRYVPTDQASNFTVSVPPSAEPARITLRTERRKPVAIERVTLSQNLERVSLTGLPEFTADIARGETYHPVSGLEAGTEYAFSVEAVGYAGSASDLTYINTAGQSAIGETGADSAADENSPAEYFRIDGTRVILPAVPGIYIRRQGAKTEKIIIK